MAGPHDCHLVTGPYLMNLLCSDNLGSDAPLAKNTFLHIEEERSASTAWKRAMADLSVLSKSGSDSHSRSLSTGQEGRMPDGNLSSEMLGIRKGSSRCDGQDAVSWAAGPNAQGLELNDISNMRGSAFRCGCAVLEPSGSEEEEGQKEGQKEVAGEPCSRNWGPEHIDISEFRSASGDSCVVPGASWSAGAEGHEDGTCKPCGFNWKPGGCNKGVACQFCHMCGPDELRKRKSERHAFLKAKKQESRGLHGTNRNSEGTRQSSAWGRA